MKEVRRMFVFKELDGLILSAIAYFDIVDYRAGMLFSTHLETLFQSTPKALDFYQKMNEFCKVQNYYKFLDFEITDYYNDNQKSGLVYMIIENKETQIIIFRGSEIYDEFNHDCGWEDWIDNLKIFVSVTPQQLKTLALFNEKKTNKQRYMIGHSKGGNLALFMALVSNQDFFDQLEAIYTYNAPGINKALLDMYQERMNSEAFISKVHCLENEHDCVSSMFYAVTQPKIVASYFPNRNFMEAFDNHQCYAFETFLDTFVCRNEKTAMPKTTEILINQLFEGLPLNTKRDFIDQLIEVMHHECSVNELYHALLYQIGLNYQLFQNMKEEDIKRIEIDTLFNQIKDKVISIPEKVYKALEETLMQFRKEKPHEEDSLDR